MIRLQVLFIKKTNETKSETTISHIGGKCGERFWKHSMKEAISYYRSGMFCYYVNIDGADVDLILKKIGRVEYLKSKVDAVNPKSLLLLSEFKKKSGNYMTVDDLLALKIRENNLDENTASNSQRININDFDYELEFISGSRFTKRIVNDKTELISHVSPTPKINELDNNKEDNVVATDKLDKVISTTIVRSQTAESKVINEILKPLGGNWKTGERIMGEAEYQHLVNYCEYIATKGKLPETIIEINTPVLKLERVFISNTLLNLWIELGAGKNKRALFVELLGEVFTLFKSRSLRTNTNHFSDRFPNYNKVLQELFA